jgi:hypothetical protein
MGAAQASVRASSEASVRAGQLPDLMLKAGIDNLPVTGQQKFTVGQDFMTMRRIGIDACRCAGPRNHRHRTRCLRGRRNRRGLPVKRFYRVCTASEAAP